MSNATSSMLDALLRVPVVYQPKVSPDGRWVAWSWFHRDERANVWLAAIDSLSPPIRLTSCDQDVSVVSWSPDSQSLIVESCDDGNERMRLYRLDLAQPGEMSLLTEEDPNYFVHGGSLHHNQKWLIYGANRDFARDVQLDATWVYRHDLKTGKRKLLAAPQRSPEKGSRNAPVLNNQGTHVLYCRADAHPAGQQVWLTDVHGKVDRQILNFGDMSKTSACWMPDGKRVLFVTEVQHYRRLGIFDRRDDSVEWLINDPQRNIEGAWAPKGTDLVAVLEVKNAHEHCFLLDVESKRVVHLLPWQDRGTLIPLAVCPSGLWIGAYYDSVRANELVKFALPESGHIAGWNALPDGTKRVKATSLLRRSRAQSSLEKRLVKAEDFFWQSVDGMDMHGFLYRSRNPIGTIVLVHGGPRERSEARFEVCAQYLTSEGFNVFLPNYRGSTGYGLHFQDEIKVDGWGGTEQKI